ncbi:nascent polypeptide-associated complex protein [Candidatus Methanomassiliicoccus intestinalis]|uniref:nascent polypeptide-associated complex protein n=1 Tax=Candidatus Methanomassiliicoccus intestinalis TaxID=1406512 RepID=UPI0037DC6614
MMRGVNPRQIERAMKQAGIRTKEIGDVEEVIIRTKSEEYVITNASVTMMDMKGQKTYQVMGDTEIRPRSASQSAQPAEEVIPEEDIQLIMDQTGASREAAIQALKDCGGQPAEAIIKLIS